MYAWDLDSVLLSAAAAVVPERGLAGLTITAVAEHHRVTRQAVQNWLRNHEYVLIDRMAFVFFDRWPSWTYQRICLGRGLSGLLPDSEEVERWTRLYLALVEGGHRASALAEVVARGLEEERTIIQRGLPGVDAMAAQTLVIGLRHARCAQPPLISTEEAATLLTALLPASSDERTA